MEACSIILQPAVEKGGKHFPLSDHNIFQLGEKEKENCFVRTNGLGLKSFCLGKDIAPLWWWVYFCTFLSFVVHFCPSLSIFVPGEQSNSPSAALQSITLPSSTTRTTGRPGPTVQKFDYTVSTEQAGALVLGVLALVLSSTSIDELMLLLLVLTVLAMIPEVLRELALVLTVLELVLTRLTVLTLSVMVVLVDAWNHPFAIPLIIQYPLKKLGHLSWGTGTGTYSKY